MLKNNKGITLISVVITVIMMITILSSIIYSNNNSNELKEEMLLNSDIEQLNKKVQLYYLKNKTLPIDESVYLDNEEDGLKYYKLKTSLLENLNLKNLEKIEYEETFTDNDQWYVINKETHLIYFVKYINGEIEFQEGKYSEKYENIIGNIPSDIKFNFITSINTGKSDIELLETKVQELLQNNVTIPIDSNISLEKNGITYHKIETDKLDDLNLQKPVNDTQFYVINLDKLPDTLEIHFVVDGEIKEEINQDGEEKGEQKGEDKIEIKEGREYAAYIGWRKGGTVKEESLVLQYDGQYNAIGDDGKPIADTTATTWADLTNNGNNGKIVNGNGYLEYDFRVQSNDNIVERFWDEGTRQIATENYSWEENGRTYT